MKKTKSDKTCPECGHDPIDHLIEGKNMNLYKKKRLDRKMARDYCTEHEMLYTGHKCKPIWKGCCGILDRYDIKLIASKVKW